MIGNFHTSAPSTAPLPIAGFQSGAIPDTERFDAWRHSLGPCHEIRPLVDAPGGHPSVSSTGWALEDLTLTELSFSPSSYRRRADDGRVLVRLYREGRAQGVLGDTEFATAPGEIHVFDQAATCHGSTIGRQSMKSIFLPHCAVGYLSGSHPAHIRVRPDTAIGRVLQSSIELLFNELPYADRSEASRLAAGVSGVIRGLLLSDSRGANDSTDFHAARRQAMRRFLEQHLAERELGIEKLCAAVFVSRATVYRDFAEEGGVARFVTRCRLERAFHDLATGVAERGRVRRVAERWGFASQYHFSRLFRQQFHVAPSEVVASTAADTTGSST